MEGLFNRVKDPGTKQAVMRLEQMLDALQKATGTSVSAATTEPGITVHGQLKGLDANDHPQYALATALILPPGLITPYGGSTAPTGWLLCQGQAVSRTTYAALFAVVSTTYGVGDGSTTFALPDLRGKVPIGASATYTRGASGGAETITLTTGMIPAHTHTVRDDQHMHDTSDGGHSHTQAAHSHSFLAGHSPLVWADGNTLGVPSGGTANYADQVGANYTQSTTPSINSALTGLGVMSASSNISITSSGGTGGSHGNMQPYQVVNYIIKT